MFKTFRVSLLVISCLFYDLTLALMPVSTDASPRISVRLALVKTAYPAGEPVELKVQIHNRSPQDIFIGREIYGFDNDVCHLTLTVRDDRGRESPHGMMVGDSVSTRKESFLHLLLENWLALPPETFYGTTVALDRDWFKFLGKPGRYLISGKYHCSSMREPSPNNPLGDRAEEIAKLPYSVWEGEVKTNTVWVKIVPSPNASAGRKGVQ